MRKQEIIGANEKISEPKNYLIKFFFSCGKHLSMHRFVTSREMSCKVSSKVNVGFLHCRVSDATGNLTAISAWTFAASAEVTAVLVAW